MPTILQRSVTAIATGALIAASPTAWPALEKDLAKLPAISTAGSHSGQEIRWQRGAVDNVFVAARASNKPVFLYWGARWCPPCNQVKATIFNRQDFVEISRFFLPVYIDGDNPGAQKLGARFKVRGYPTMILFKPNGDEITRLPGEVDPERYIQVLRIGINASKPVKAILESALAANGGNTALTADDWRLLAFYSWDTDEQQLLPARDIAATLKRLAMASQIEAPDVSARFALRALAAEATAKETKPTPDSTTIPQLLAMLGNSKLARENFDLIVNYAADIPAYLGPLSQDTQKSLLVAWNASLDQFLADRSLSTADRLTAMAGKVALAKIEHDSPLPDSILQQARAQVAHADGTTTDGYARQSVISAAADVLTEAGMLDESDRLLKTELKRSHSPYYFMLGLAANAKKRGEKAAAIDWTAKAYAAATGPATRLQWGASYIKAMTELAPEDEVPIESVTKRLLNELKTAPETFYERNLRSLERIGKSLRDWNKKQDHDAVAKRLQAQLDGICKKLPAADPSRAACSSITIQASS